MERIRCFIAIDVEDSELRANLVKAQEALRDTGVKMKLVEPGNLHLTLRFLGELPRPRVEEIAEALGAVDFTEFEMSVEGLGAFPRVSRPRVIWAGVSRGREELAQLHRRISKALSGLGLREDREFSAHITLARVKFGRDYGRLAEVIRSYSSHFFGSQRVKTFKLKRSVLTSRGPVYSDISVYEAENA